MRHDTVALGSAKLARYDWTEDGVAAIFIGARNTADRWLVQIPESGPFIEVEVQWQDTAQMALDEEFGDLLRREIEKARASRREALDGAMQHA